MEVLSEEQRSRHLADKLDNLLFSKQVSLRKLSSETGLGLSNLSKIKNNAFKTFPRFSTIQTLATYFDVPISELDIMYDVDYKQRKQISQNTLQISNKYNLELLTCIQIHYPVLYDYLLLLSHKGFSFSLGPTKKGAASYPDEPQNEFYERVKRYEKIELGYFMITTTYPNGSKKTNNLHRFYGIIEKTDDYLDYLLFKQLQ